MAEVEHCRQCGAELPSGTAGQPCPACLMRLGLESWAQKSALAEERASLATVAHRSRFVPAEPAELAAHFPRLEILELLGQGGMGAVYKARQRDLDRAIALKILPPEVSEDPAFTQRFTQEAKALAQLNHPHIVTVHDFGQAGGLFYFVMEYVDGVNLRQALRAGHLQQAEALKIVPQICEALQFAHDEGVVHRDIKPENILLDKKGRVKIADFGLAKLLGQVPAGARLTGSHQVMGTPHYMAPEQIERPQQVDHRADIYSLGVVFYEMLTGELPIGKFSPPSQKVQVDVRLDQVVLRLLEKQPERRYQQASDVKTDVEAIAGGRSVGLAPEPDSGPPAAERQLEAYEQQARRECERLLPPARRAKILGHLDKGERLIWIGRPRPAYAIRTALMVGLPVYAGIAAFYFLVLRNLLKKASQVLAQAGRHHNYELVGDLLLLSLFVLTVLGFWSAWSRIVYLMTDRRAIIACFNILGMTRVKSYRPALLESADCFPKRGGSGSLIFERYLGALVTVGFKEIERVREVQELIRKVVLSDWVAGPQATKAMAMSAHPDPTPFADIQQRAQAPAEQRRQRTGGRADDGLPAP